MSSDVSFVSSDATTLLIEARTAILRVQQLVGHKKSKVTIHTREASYVGLVVGIDIARQSLRLYIDDGVTVVIPFHALTLGPTEGKGYDKNPEK